MNKLVDQYNNTYDLSINKNFINAYCSTLTEKIETNIKDPQPKVNDRVRITKNKNIFSKDYTKNWSREIVIIDSILKINPWNYKIKDLNGEKIIGSFYEKELLLSILEMSYYPEPDNHFIALKAEIDKLDINKLVNVSTSLNNLKTKID